LEGRKEAGWQGGLIFPGRARERQEEGREARRSREKRQDPLTIFP
jgi:hypothetical protein